MTRNKTSTFAATLIIAGSVQFAYATEQSEKRQDARDIKQTGNQDARNLKSDCKANDEKSRPECRQDKREVKQDSRDAARAIIRK